MIFEIGKYYEHTTGIQLHICGRAKTHLYGDCLVSERGMSIFKKVSKESWEKSKLSEVSMNETIKGYDKGYSNYDLHPVGESESNTIGYREITKEEFMLSNFDLGDKKIIYERRLKLNKLINENR